MGTRADQQLQTLDNLLSQNNIKKASTIGAIIDSTNPYFDYKQNKFVKKIKIIDESMNTARTTSTFRYGYCTVMFFSDKIEQLPNPFAIGDIIYLRRFAFQVYDETFQARINPTTYCSWALLHGDVHNNDFAEYQLSKSDFNFNQDKYTDMKENVKELKQFTRRFLEKTSVLLSVPAGITPKDQDFVVQVVRKNEQGVMRLRDGKREIILRNCPSFVEQKQIGKLRSVAKVRLNEDNENEVVTNNFTSLLKLPEWTVDAQTFLQQENAMEVEEETQMYTDLSYLNSAPLSKIEGKKFFIRCEVFNISAKTFNEAVKYYDGKKNTVSDKASDSSIPVYKIAFSCQDNSIKNDKKEKLVDIWLYSYDGQGSDFVDKVALTHLSEFSSLKQENIFYERKYNAILESEQVKMTIEVLNNGKDNKAFRALNIKC